VASCGGSSVFLPVRGSNSVALRCSVLFFRWPGTGRGRGVGGVGSKGEPLREKRVHVSEFCPVGGAVVFMREEGKLR